MPALSITLTYEQWKAEGEKRFGPERSKWKFVCPTCGTVTSVAEWRAAGAPEGAVGFSCIGRYKGVARDAFRNTGQGPCNYTGGGLFKLNPVTVKTPDGGAIQMFEFAPAEERKDGEEATQGG